MSPKGTDAIVVMVIPDHSDNESDIDSAFCQRLVNCHQCCKMCSEDLTDGCNIKEHTTQTATLKNSCDACSRGDDTLLKPCGHCGLADRNTSDGGHYRQEFRCHQLSAAPPPLCCRRPRMLNNSGFPRFQRPEIFHKFQPRKVLCRRKYTENMGHFQKHYGLNVLDHESFNAGELRPDYPSKSDHLRTRKFRFHPYGRPLSRQQRSTSTGRLEEAVKSLHIDMKDFGADDISVGVLGQKLRVSASRGPSNDPEILVKHQVTVDNNFDCEKTTCSLGTDGVLNIDIPSKSVYTNDWIFDVSDDEDEENSDEYK